MSSILFLQTLILSTSLSGLFAVIGFVGYEAFDRFVNPSPFAVEKTAMDIILIAGMTTVGLVCTAAACYLTYRHFQNNWNEE